MKLQTIIWPALLTAVLGVPVISALLHKVPNILDTEIVSEGSNWPGTAVDLGVTYLPGGVKRAQVGFWQQRPERIIGHQEIHLQFVTYDSAPTLLGGEIRIRGTECVYQAEPGARMSDGRYIAFKRGTACGSPFPASSPGRIDLTVTFRGPGHLGLVSYWIPASQYNPEWMSFSDPAPGGESLLAVARGLYVDSFSGPARRRADLLAYMWQGSTSTAWLWGAVVLALALVFAAGMMLAPAENRDGPVEAVSGAVGVACLGLALALFYVVLIPPLQAPDEPDHMLAFAVVADRPALNEGTSALARTGHFDRIRFHGDSRFRPVDIGSPAPTAWGEEVFAHNVAERSATTWIWWKLLARAVRPFDTANALLTIRFANALLFALVLGIAAAMVRISGSGSIAAPYAVALALLLVPTLPFFATQVSEFAVLTSAYLVVAMMIAGLCLEGPRVHLLGLPLGLAMAAVFGSGRSGLPFGAVLAAVVAGRAWLGSRSDGRAGHDIGRSLIFWAGLGAGLAAFEWLSIPAFRNGLWLGDAAPVPEGIKALIGPLRVHPGWITAVAPMGFAFELATGWFRRRVATPGRFVTGSVRWLCYGAAASIIVSLAASIFVSYPILETRELAPAASAGEYARRILAVALSGMRLRHHDLLLSSSFWEGFGWVDTLPGDGFMSVLVLLTATAAIGLLIQVGRSGDVRRAIWLALLVVGWVAALVLYAVSSYYLHRNLLGRYLIGFYLSSVVVFWSVAAMLPRRVVPRPAWHAGINREWLIAAAACGIHGWALRFILARYF